jgi:hypothetical protein
LRGGGDVGLGEDARGPGHITDPVGVSLEGLSEVVSFGLRAKGYPVSSRHSCTFGMFYQ